MSTVLTGNEEEKLLEKEKDRLSSEASLAPPDEPHSPPTQTDPASQISSPSPRRLWHAGSLTYGAAGLTILFFWLLWGDFSLALKERSVPTALQLIFKQYKASDLITGFLMGSMPLVISLIISPIVSYRSDRHRGRWGRRIPFLLVPTPIAFVSMIGLAYSPTMGRWLRSMLGAFSPGESTNVLFCLGVFWAVFEFCSITCGAVYGALINDVVPHELLGRFYGLFRVFSLLAGMAFSYFLLGHVEAHCFAIFLGIGTLYLVSFSAMCFRVKEGTYAPVSPPQEQNTAPLAGGFLPAVATYFRECFTHSYYRWIFLSGTLGALATLPIGLFFIYYAKSVNLDMATWGKYSTLMLFFSLLQAYPLGWLADKFHPIRMTLVALALYAIATLAAFFLIHGPQTLGIIQIVCGVLAGCWATVAAPLGAMLLPKSRFATLTSAGAVCSALAGIIVSPMCGWLLDWLHHDYRFIYLWASVFTTLALLATVVVYRKFMSFGGPKGYVAPE